MPRILAPAKINLFLRIVRRRPDGYHEIETLFQRVGLRDEIELEPLTGAGGSVRLSIEGAGLEGDALDDNLIVKAWRALNEATGGKILPVRAVLSKHIPVGGGLGGGSSDAAAMLAACVRLFNPGLDDAALRRIAARLGADVPFFLGPPAAVGRGIGEILESVPHAAPFWAVLAFPPYGVSTRDVYRAWDPAAAGETGDLPGLIEALTEADLGGALARLFNNMEAPAFGIRPDLGDLRQRLENLAGQTVRMSGSGSTLFTLAAGQDAAAEIEQRWRNAEKIAAVSVPFEC